MLHIREFHQPVTMRVLDYAVWRVTLNAVNHVQQHVLDDAATLAVHLAAMYAQDVPHYVIHLANRSVKITQDLHV